MAPSRNRSRLLAVAVLAVAVLCACTMCQSPGDPASATRPTTAPAAAATSPATAPATAPTETILTVTVKDLHNRKGELIFGVFTQADGFPNVKARSVYWEVKPADAGAVTFTTRLPPGRYAAGVLHDENRNGDMDRGLGGIPLEGYGVTNNPKPRFRKATFGEATFTLPPDGAQKTISVQYF